MFGARHGFRVCTSAGYFGGYIGDGESKRDWLRERMLTWEKNINTISKNAGIYPQDSYAAVIHTIKSEWIFLQRLNWDTGDSFAVLKKMIHKTFLPRLFFGRTKTLSPVVGAISTMPVSKAGLGLLNPFTSAHENYLSSM